MQITDYCAFNLLVLSIRGNICELFTENMKEEKMNKYKTFSIPAILVVFVLFCFINNSEAANITSLSVTANTDYGSGGD